MHARQGSGDTVGAISEKKKKFNDPAFRGISVFLTFCFHLFIL